MTTPASSRHARKCRCHVAWRGAGLDHRLVTDDCRTHEPDREGLRIARRLEELAELRKEAR